MDADQDGGLSQEEIASHIRKIVDSRLGAIQVACVVLHRGRPVPGVHVRFVPEPFLEGLVQPAEGVTSDGGMGVAVLTLEDGTTSGIQPGFYRVELSRMVNGRETLPAKFNHETMLGREISYESDELRVDSVLKFIID